ncbi:hypothetical protein P9112_006526 [Eukaryota sp. TZLM1-RC]
MYEDDLFNFLSSSAVVDQDLHSLLLENGVCENKSSDSSLFVTIVPRRISEHPQTLYSMSDIFQQDISDSNPPLIMQQVPATHIHDIEGNEATDPDPTSPSLKIEEDERVDEVPPSSATEEVTRTDSAPSPLKAMEEATRTDPAPSPLPIPEPVSKKNGWKSHLRHVFPIRRI